MGVDTCQYTVILTSWFVPWARVPLASRCDDMIDWDSRMEMALSVLGGI
jgi:hypothetical protein